MDKNAIKKYAVWARRELIERVSKRAQIYGISEENIIDPAADSVGVHVLSRTEKRQRQALIAKIRDEGWQQVMEEAAYTWFNRFAALRFMEVNGYLPSHVRVFTNDAGEFKPQILAEAIRLELDGLDRNRVYELESANEREELYKYLIITQCNALSGILPGMFQQIEDYTELLFPDNMLREGSVIEQMVTMIPEQDWTDQVQIIGWLYQYYISEKKDEVFANLKKNIKISKENIPAATQLFTPDWIVRYMVENSLGRIYIDKRKTEGIFADGRDPEEMTWDEIEESRIATEKEIAQQMGWKYFLPEAKQTPEVRKQLSADSCSLIDDPTQLRVIDPCCGSGHILCVLFDVLVQIYEVRGYTAREAAVKIVQNNLWGLDIDDRAAQLAYFTVMMKARHYDRRFFSRNIQPNVYAVQESNRLDADYVNFFIDGRDDLRSALGTLTRELIDAKEYGSILNITPVDFDTLYARFDEIADEVSMYAKPVYSVLLPFVRMAQALVQSYDIVTTNPPYLGSSGMSAKLYDFVKKNYPDSKSDLFAVFIEKCGNILKPDGYQAMITQHAWMFLSSFEKLRKKLLERDTINMAHLGARAFEEIGGEVVQTTSFVLRNTCLENYQGTYSRLVVPTTQAGKEAMFLNGDNRYFAKQTMFSNLPGSPIAYWISRAVYDAYVYSPKLGEIATPKQGLATTDNNRFVRFWYELPFAGIGFGYTSREAAWSGIKWFPLNKGGEYRKWYGNNDYVVNYQYDGKEIKESVLRKYSYLKTPDFVVKNQPYYFLENGTWSAISTGSISVRYSPAGFVISNAGMAIYSKDLLKYIIAFMNSKCVSDSLLKVISQTLNFNAGDIERIPFIVDEARKNEITNLADECISIAKAEWDSYEISWDFIRHPFICGLSTIEESFLHWKQLSEERFVSLKEKEEKINAAFIDIYSLNTELHPDVADDSVTLRKADLQRDVRSFISYAVGCMFGRYSLDEPGLIYTGGKFEQSKYVSFNPDNDAIIPICDDEYFEDDIVGRFVKFVEVVYGKNTLEKNLNFIAEVLGGKGSSRDIIRYYFINEFYADHLKVYQKRPIYWLFESGKKNGFKCLIYMHRYQPDTIARIRTDYIHEQQSRYRTIMADLEQRINGASASERVKMNKRIAVLKAQATEIRIYEEKIHHLADQMIQIDLDDGVKNNYTLFKDVLHNI